MSIFDLNLDYFSEMELAQLENIAFLLNEAPAPDEIPTQESQKLDNEFDVYDFDQYEEIIGGLFEEPLEGIEENVVKTPEEMVTNQETIEPVNTGCLRDFLALKSKNSCNACDKKYMYRSSLIRHIGQSHPENEQLKLEILESNKIKTNVVKATYHCFVCKKYYKGNEGYTRHINTVHRNDIDGVPNALNILNYSFHCKLCKRLFKSRKSLLNHLKKIHPGFKEPPQLYNCLVCGRQFKTDYHQQLHTEIHA